MNYHNSRVTDGARTRDSWSHNPRVIKWLRELSSLRWFSAGLENRGGIESVAPGARKSTLPCADDSDVFAALRRNVSGGNR